MSPNLSEYWCGYCGRHIIKKNFNDLVQHLNLCFIQHLVACELVKTSKPKEYRTLEVKSFDATNKANLR
jgi:hypothetical protein